MSSSSDVASRRASVLVAERPTARPAFPDLSTPEYSSRTRADLVDRRAAAWQAGYTDGYSSGQAEAATAAEPTRQQLAQDLAGATALLDALRDAVGELRAREARALDETARVVGEVAVALAEGVLGREVSTSVDALARALALVPPGEDPLVRLHPDDVDAVVAPEGVRVMADPRVERFGCVVDLGEATIDAQLGPALARARAVLLDDSEEAW